MVLERIEEVDINSPPSNTSIVGLDEFRKAEFLPEAMIVKEEIWFTNSWYIVVK